MVRLPPVLLCLALAGCRAPAQGDPVVPPTHTNHLINESSPYLLMHAHNPVDWYPWGEEAFAKARAEQKPIFLSVGYATCYWCHVMERESFENEAIAAILNRDFVCIKVDREERPDIDELYMTAVQMLTGQGGWPMSVWLTPDLKPFFGGTYFPPDSRYGRPGFPDLLQRLANAWREQRAEVEQQALQVAQAVSQYAAGRTTRTPVTQAGIQAAAQAILANQDPVNGGPQGSPKFPPDMACELLLTLFQETGDQAAADYVTKALDQMASGGLWDHLDGGFHRYSVDATWTVPHFEKMLYNQALLLRTYADAAVVLHRPDYARTAVRLADFVQRRLTDPQTGAFYSALDAETEAEEGRSYVWSRDELNQALADQPEAGLLRRLYGLDQPPNFEGNRYVLRLTEPLTDSALEERLQPVRQHLLGLRDQRPQPLCDDKVLTSWNALMISALARAGDELGQPGMVAQADRAARFLLDNLRTADGGLLRVYRNGDAKQPGFLDDYAFLAEALLDLHRATGDERWLGSADELVRQMNQRFADPAGGYFYTVDGQSDLFARSRNPQDNALPAGSSVAVEVLSRLAEVHSDGALRQQARQAAEAVFGLAQQAPSGFAYLLRAAWEVAGDGPAVAAPAAVDSARHVRLSARRTPGGVEAVLTIDEGWHLAAHGVATDGLAGTVLAVTGAEATAFEYPEGASFAAAGQPAVEVYTGRVMIPIRLADRVAKLTITARVQACDDRVCLRPATLTATVE